MFACRVLSASKRLLVFFASTNSKQAKMQLMNELINHSVFILSIDARECRNADFAKSSKLIRISEERR